MSGTAYPGHRGRSDPSSAFSQHDFHIEQKLGRVRTAVPVLIKKVHADKQTVDVQPMVHQVDGQGKPTPHGTIYGIPYTSQSGGNGMAVIVPKVGDKGLMVVADRDISKVIASGAPATPGSNRTHDLADGVYIGGFGKINGTPPQSITFDEKGVVLKDRNGNVITQKGGGTYVDPGSGTLYLGGSGSGTYDYVMTNSGPSSNVKAKL